MDSHKILIKTRRWDDNACLGVRNTSSMGLCIFSLDQKPAGILCSIVRRWHRWVQQWAIVRLRSIMHSISSVKNKQNRITQAFRLKFFQSCLLQNIMSISNVKECVWTDSNFQIFWTIVCISFANHLLISNESSIVQFWFGIRSFK